MKLKINKKQVSLFLVIVLGSFLFVHFARAGWVVDVVGWLCAAIVYCLGQILIYVMKGVIYVAQYSDFIHSPAVSKGWIIMRDICNMFFVLILLVIAFATILKIEKYSYKKYLPKLILMAVLINFSKTICGLLIDVAQVVMLTFVNAFKTIGGGSLVDMLGITQWQSMGTDSQTFGDWTAMGAYVFAVVYVVVALVVLITMLMMLVMRIVMIWIYVVLSPMAYLLAAFPGGEQYSSRWWKDFTKNLVVGPVMAFFIWLSFAAVSPGSTGTGAGGALPVPGASMDVTTPGAIAATAGVDKFGSGDLLIKFIISIGMLVAGLKISQEIGGAAGDMAGKGMGALNKGRSMVSKGAMGGLAAVTGYNFAKRRYGAWRQDRKKKGEQRSDLIYETIKGGATGVVKGVGMTIGRGAKKLGSKVVDAAGETKAGTWMAKKGGQFKNIVDDLKEGNRSNKARQEAYHTGTYVDKNGTKYDYNEEKDHYVDEKGNVATTDGKAVKYNKQTQKYEDQDGSEVRDVKKVEKMGIASSAMRDGMTSGMTKARALSNQIKDERMAKKQKLFEDAGTSTGQLKRILSDSAASKEKKLGAIMALSIKEGFKTKDHASGRSLVNESKKVIGNNAPLLKKFEDSLNKRYAHLNYDLSSDGGRNKYKQAMDEGRFDGYSQDSTAYNKDTMETLKDYSGVDFKGDIKKTASKSKQHREAIVEGSAGARNASLGPNGEVFDEATDKINEFAKLMVDLGGNIATAFGNTTVNQNGSKTINFDADAAMAAQKYFENAKASDMESFNNDLLDPDKISGFLGKQGYDVPSDQGNDIATQIKDAMREGLDVSKLATMARGDNNIEFVKRAIGAIQQNGPDKKRDQIKDNNILVTIKPIV